MEHNLSEEQRRELAGRARTLHERLDGPSNEPRGELSIDPDLVLEEWKNKYPDEGSFNNRLEREGLTETIIREQAAATHWPTNESLPDWIAEIEALIQYVESSPINDRSFIDIPDETPFSELIRELTGYAYEQLPKKIIPLVTTPPMIEWLVARFEMICTRPLYIEFESFINHYAPELAQVDPETFIDPPTTYYDQFIEAIFDGGFSSLCLEYPVLARHLVRIVDSWIETVKEVYQRVSTDRSVLHNRFDIDGDMVALEPLANDTHAGGRIPIRVSFEEGETIYKPHGIGMGILFHTILDRLSDHIPSLSFKYPEYVRRNGYGWMESIKYRDLPDEASIDDYYERAGGILCLSYVLNFSDCQYSNVIVDSEYPMIIDTETLFHPYVEIDVSSAMTSAIAAVDQSILLTALLPWSVGDPRAWGERSITNLAAGFGKESGQSKVPRHTRPVIKRVNTDVMTVEAESPTVDHSTNTSTINGNDQPPGEHIDAIIRGFSRTYKVIRELHADGHFLSEIVDSELIDKCKNRLLYRATKLYGSILRSAAARDPLRDGIWFSVVLDELVAPFFDEQNTMDRHWPLYNAERKALRRLDYPRLTSYPNQKTIFHDGEGLGVAADMSGYERCRQRLNTMDTDDLSRQRWLIRQSFGGDTPTASPLFDIDIDGTSDLTDGTLQRTAVELFDDVLDAAIHTKNGKGWVSVCPTNSAFSLIPAGPSLYYGKGGIALPAAALYKVTGQDRYQQLVREILDPIINGRIIKGTSFGLGGTRGTGSIVYTLSVIAELLDEKIYRKKALEATRAVTEDRLVTDDTFDIMEGSAGTLLGLLAYYDRYGGSSVLDRAIACGDRLLKARVSVDSHQVWMTTDDNVPLTGFAHGSSGIAYALARLASIADIPRYAEAAQEVVAFNSTLYSSTQNNWAYSPKENKYLDKWCHGRSGIALAQIGINEQFGDEISLNEVNAALSATATATPSPVDHVCCGNFGRIETLLVGSRRAGGHRTDATELAKRCLARRERDGTFAFQGHSASFVNPSFFNGISGAVYTLLRLRNPDMLPSILLLE